MSRTFAFIPARGGSRRVPGKNRKLLGGKPLLAHTVLAAQASGVFDEILVNSDDPRILGLAKKFGAMPYARPAALGKNEIFVLEVLKEMIQTLALEPSDSLAVLFPTNPLRTALDIRQTFAEFQRRKKKDRVVTVCRYEYPVQVAFCPDRAGRMRPMFPAEYRRSSRHDDKSACFRANYAVIWDTVRAFLAGQKLVAPGSIPWEMPWERSIDIDDPYQFRLAHLLLSRR